MAPGPPVAGPTAQMFLARTGELELTDAQVVRLAAITRRSEARRKAMMAAMDSARMRAEGQPGDTAMRRQFAQRMRADMQRADEQRRADLRDALAVLTPEQQAKAWDMAAMRGQRMRAQRPMRGMEGRGRMRGMRRDFRAPRGPGDRMGQQPMGRQPGFRAPRPPVETGNGE